MIGVGHGPKRGTMVVTIISWMAIFPILTSIGFALSKLIKKIFEYEVQGFHSIIMLGLVFCTVYAEAFSLIYRLGKVSFIVLSIIMVLSLLYAGGEVYDEVLELKRRIREDRPKYISLCVIFFGLLFLASFFASRDPVGFDTENYHIPDIRWLEEYGAVKGVGNLASRFAYNSAFHCLQALFSFVWVGGMSLHSMNGFIWLFTAMYAVSSCAFFSNRRFGLSDILRFILIWIIFGCLILGFNEPLAAPITDFMPLCLIGYIFVEWCTLNEFEIDNEVPYGLLSILGLFAASVKLSAAIVFILALKPVMGLIKKHRVLHIIKFVVMGFLVMLPFVARSVVISGYLVYPVAGIDLFNVDWKMPRAVAVTDDAAIKLFARAAGAKYSYLNITDRFGTWFVNWLQHNWAQYSVLAIAGLIIAPCELVVVMYMILKKRRGLYDHMVYAGAACGFLFFITSAPALRFGIIWLFILPCVCIGGLYDHLTMADPDDEKTVYIKRLKTPQTYYTTASIVMLFCSVYFYMLYMSYGFDAKIVPKDYVHTKNEEYTYKISGIKFYYTNPDDGELRSVNGTEGLIGYDGFPGGCDLAYLKRVELRGDRIEDGFRPKAGYVKQLYGYTGEVLSDEEIKVLGLD